MTSDAVWVVGADLGVYRIDPRTNKRVGGRVRAYRGGRHRRRRRRRLGDRVWGRCRREDRPAHEHDHAEDPRRVSRPQLARCWRPRRLGGGPVRWPRLAYRPRAEAPRTIPLDVGVTWVAVGAGAVWATNELAGLVYRIDPSTNKAQSSTDGRARDGRRRRGRRLGQRRRAAVLRHGSADLDLYPDARRRGGRPAVPDRLRSPVEERGTSLPHTRWWRRSSSSSSGVTTGPARTRSATSPATTRPPRGVGSTPFAATRTRRRTRATPT